MLPDIMYILIGAAVGGLLGFWVARTIFAARLGDSEVAREKLEKNSAVLNTQVQDLLQHKARLESELTAERQVLTEFKKQMSDHFEAISAKITKDNQQSFFTLAQESFKHDQEKREISLKGMIDPVHKNLEDLQKFVNEMEKQRHGAFTELTQNLSLIRDDHSKLRAATSSLAQALRSPNKRGLWGEVNLRRAIEAVGMVENVSFTQQDTLETENGFQKPDVIIHLPGKRSIIIDAKVPIDAFLDAAQDGISEDERKRALERHAEQVRKKIKDLGSKAYWENLDSSPEFVLMYLPGDAYYAAALESDPNLFEAGIENKVFLMTPATLIPTLRVIEHAWKQEKLALNAKNIAKLGQELYNRLCTFSKHFETMGNGLTSALTNYNKAIGSFENSLMPAARKFREYQSMTEDDKLSALEPIEKIPRQLLLADTDNPALKKVENS